VSGEFGKAFWEERYRGHTAVSSRRPNPQLVAEAGDLAPGTALDAGCGEGADAIWLASRGWRVTAVDFATTALRRAREHAETLGADITSTSPRPGPDRPPTPTATRSPFATPSFEPASVHDLRRSAQRGTPIPRA
jgi:SAM-dependent methyltransferase